MKSNQKKNKKWIQWKKQKKKKANKKLQFIIIIIFIFIYFYFLAFTWLQACFLGNMEVIWCNSLGDGHFQTYVIDNVEILFNYYLHINFYVSHTLTSCTHHSQIFVKLSTYDCVLTNLVILNCIWFDV